MYSFQIVEDDDSCNNNVSLTQIGETQLESRLIEFGVQPKLGMIWLITSKTKLIIWDEAPLMHKHCFETLDCSLRDILRSQNDGIQISHSLERLSYLAVISDKSSK
ncbi:PIF1-like helicase [Medicago truncatula]|uniref:ATP-dependent DNA helicase n=1 Tax=Medicago truncatula TaxID=3880 RepID=G7IDC8_MEDTR|nr:PIF1-like helicase [Medicago truncatula]